MRVPIMLWDRNVSETVPDHDTHAASILGDVGGLETDVECVHVVADTDIDDLGIGDACRLAVEHAHERCIYVNVDGISDLVRQSEVQTDHDTATIAHNVVHKTITGTDGERQIHHDVACVGVDTDGRNLIAVSEVYGDVQASSHVKRITVDEAISEANADHLLDAAAVTEDICGQTDITAMEPTQLGFGPP